MYQTAVIINHKEPIEVPDCLYKTKSYRSPNLEPGNNEITFDITQQAGLNSEMALLNNQQEKVLKQLDELSEQMLKLKQFLNLKPKATIQEKELKCGKIYDFVVNVNPSNPPYSLLLLQKLWTDKIKLVIKSHVHSSVTKLTENAIEFMKIAEKYEFVSSYPCINLMLIWKNVNETSMLVSDNSIPIYGEINLLRHLSRIGLNAYNYELLKNPTKIDYILDVCYMLLNSKNKTEKHQMLTSLSTALGKNQWMCEDNISIADLAANSVIKQVLNVNELNVHLLKWYNKCETIVH